MTKIRTMRGQEIDTDLIRMKQQLMSGAKTDPTIRREDYINDRRRRSSSRRINQMLANEQMVKNKIQEDKDTKPSVKEEIPEHGVEKKKLRTIRKNDDAE